jgi:hypothetical protein
LSVRVGAGHAQLGAVEEPVVVAVGVERVDLPVAVGVVVQLARAPSSTPSSSLSASIGSVPSALRSRRSGRRRRCRRGSCRRRPFPALGSPSFASSTPLRFTSSTPSFTPPSSLSGSTGEVVVPVSPSATHVLLGVVRSRG